MAANIIVIAVVALISGLCIRKLVISRKNGGGCEGCGGNCAGCSAQCHSKGTSGKN